ncbi:MAG: cyclic nucleotide-binding domain-containing protein [Deltaproteobacteria bacterium]|nr:cyclic nucleotide-binding domain-containing protein [Deltaproteobacteria bacterium]
MDFSTMQKALNDCSLFRGMDQGQLGLLAMSAEAKEFVADDVVYRQGDDADGSFALIVSGKLEASTQQGYVLKTLNAGEIIGEVGTISQQGKRTVTLKAVEPSSLLQWHIQEIGNTSPALLKKLKDLAWRRIKDFNE